MAFGSGLYPSIPWGWLEWIFGNGAEQGEPCRFTYDVLGFLTGSIEFQDRAGHPVYVIVSKIEFIKNIYDEEYSFDFTISSDPPPAGHRPDAGRREPAEVTSTVVRYGATSRGAPIFGYTFTSLNTLEQNRDNLRDFVLMQREIGDDDEVVIERPEEGSSGG